MIYKPVVAYTRRHPRKILTTIFLFFGIIYGLISLVNHYLFRTAALDLGLTNQAMFDFAHLRVNYSTLLPNAGRMNFLASHFTLLPVLFAPLYYLFGSYTLLLIQIAAILLGGAGIYVYTKCRTQNPVIPLLVLLQFFLMWGIYSALAFDYHDNVVGAMLLPWLLHYFDRKRWWPAIISFVLLIISKENMALWGIFISVALLVKYYSDKSCRIAAVALALSAVLYFLLVTTILMPALNTTHHRYAQLFRYNHLGNSFSAIISYLITHPTIVIKHLFLNTTNIPTFNYIKAELYALILLSGGFSLLVRPWYGIMLLPLLGQKLLTHDFMLWGINYQYSIEFAPVLALATFEASSPLRAGYQTRYLCLATFLTFISTSFTLDHRKSKWYDKSMAQFYKKRHYTRHFKVSSVHKALEIIPPGAPVSALSPLVPHLAFRKYIYEFPRVDNAQFIALLLNDNPYPMTEEEYKNKITGLRQSPNWRILYDKNSLLILERQP